MLEYLAAHDDVIALQFVGLLVLAFITVGTYRVFKWLGSQLGL